MLWSTATIAERTSWSPEPPQGEGFALGVANGALWLHACYALASDMAMEPFLSSLFVSVVSERWAVSNVAPLDLGGRVVPPVWSVLPDGRRVLYFSVDLASAIVPLQQDTLFVQLSAGGRTSDVLRVEQRDALAPSTPADHALVAIEAARSGDSAAALAALRHAVAQPSIAAALDEGHRVRAIHLAQHEAPESAAEWLVEEVEWCKKLGARAVERLRFLREAPDFRGVRAQLSPF